MTSGDVLSRWLQRQHGSVVQGSLASLSPSGLLRVSDAQSRPVRVVLPVVHGGQAAVARAVDRSGASLALRVQAVSSDAEKARQMERLVAMTTVAQAARDRPGRFPAVLPVLESFVLVVPGTDVSVTAPLPEYELWCDLMTWCPQDLNGWAEAVPVASRRPASVLRLFLPLLATVRAVHEDLGIVHRDITPNNVLVDEGGRLLLADWGIAHGLAKGQTSTYTQLVGNRGFSLPPEIATGDQSIGRYTDAWYLGSLLAWMLTGQPPGSQHGPGWLPPGLPGGSVGDQVAAVVRGLCWLNPRGRMDLAQAQAVLTDAAAGRVSEHLTGPVATGAGAVLGAGAVRGAVRPAPAPGPDTDSADQTGPTTTLAGGRSQPDGPDSTSPRPDTASGGLKGRPSRSVAWRRVAAVVAVTIVMVGGLWVSSRFAAGGGSPGAAPSGSGRPTTSAPTQTPPDEDETGGDEEQTGEDKADGEEPGGDEPAGGEARRCVPTGPDDMRTCPAYAAARVQPILDDIYAATGGTQFAQIILYDKNVVGTAWAKPGQTTFDDYHWNGGTVHQLPTEFRPNPDQLFDATKVDWSQAETLANRLPELTGIDDPTVVAVLVSLGADGQVEFTASTRDSQYTPSVTADMNGNIKWMRGGKPGTPAAS